MCTKNHNHRLCCSCDMAHDRCNSYFLFWAIFCPFTPLTAWKMKNSKKNEKHPWKYHHFAQVYQKSLLYAVLIMRYGAWEMYLFFILGNFLLFYPPNSPKNKNFKKMKQKTRDIIILHKCTKTHDHMLYCSWDLVHDGCNFYFSFWALFCPFTPHNSPKNENFKNMKKPLEKSSFYTSAPKIMVICYVVLEIWHVTDIIVVFNFGQFFALLPPWQPKKWKFQKNEKKTWRYHHFTQLYQKLWL